MYFSFGNKESSIFFLTLTELEREQEFFELEGISDCLARQHPFLILNHTNKSIFTKGY